MKIFRQVIGYFLLFMLCQVAGETIVVMLSGEAPMSTGDQALLAQQVLSCIERHPYACLLASHGLLGAVLLYKKLVRRRDVIVKTEPQGSLSLVQALSGVVMGASGCLWANVMLELYERRASAGMLTAEAASPVDPTWMVFLSAALASPLIEELLFRGAIFSRMRLIVKPLPAVLCQAAIYAAMFAEGVSMLWASVFGLLMGLAVLRTNDYRAPVLIHMAYNAVSFLSDYWFEDIFSARSTTIGVLITSGLLLVAAAFFFFREPVGEANE